MPAKPQFDSFEEEVEFYHRRRDQRREEVGAALAGSPALILVDGTFRELVIVSMDTHPGAAAAPYRITTFLEDGPWGHENVQSMAAAVERLADKSWKELVVADDAAVMAWTSTPRFERGVKVAALRQAEDALRHTARTPDARDRARALEHRAHEMFDQDPEGAIALLESALRAGDPVENPSRSRPRYVQNPPWVTAVLADAYGLLEDKVPAAWLPKITDTASERGRFTGDLVELGCGGYGCVLPTLDPDVVLKVTTDTTEAEFAATLANELVAPICVRYRMIVRLAAKHRGATIHLLWRDAATKVGAKEIGAVAARIMDEQHVLAQEAYEALYQQLPEADVAPKLDAWADFLEHTRDRAKRPLVGESRGEWQERVIVGELFGGMLEVFTRQRVLLGDVHAGNIGLVNGKWKVIDPGNVAVLDR